MPYNPDFQRYLSLRLKYYDYSTVGAYFVTICVQDRKACLGKVIDGQMHLNDYGKIAYDTWETLPTRFAHMEMDHFVVMPNHTHGIIVIMEGDSHEPEKGKVTLAQVVRTYKAAVTYAIRHAGLPTFAWQTNYYEHIIRLHNPVALDRIRQYIEDNPVRWSKDDLYIP